MPRIDVSGWCEYFSENTRDLGCYDYYDEGYYDGLSLANDWIEARTNESATNRDWLCSLSAVELVNWIKNTAARMSDPELLKWMEEKHEV